MTTVFRNRLSFSVYSWYTVCSLLAQTDSYGVCCRKVKGIP
ncbi:hypothetical protein HMPREF2738_03631 [Clostridiales bacterium KLE1615]|nr:hypothetical protein HMPREF2738_03631 [Clostridiales bacterium KLE1615]